MWRVLLNLELLSTKQFNGSSGTQRKPVARRVLSSCPSPWRPWGGFHAGAVVQVKQIAAALARSKGSEESEATSQLFGRLSLTLQRCNAMMLASRLQDSDFVPPEIDGIM